MSPKSPPVGSASRNSKAFRTVFKRGRTAARSGIPVGNCPYPDSAEAAGNISFARKWRNEWMRGYRSVKQQPAEPMPP